MSKSQSVLVFSIFLFLETKPLFCIGLIMLIRLLGTLALTRVGVGRLYTLVRGHGDQYALFMAKYCSLYGGFLLMFLYKLLLLETHPFISLE